jgi:hypothetical protein
MAFEDWLPSICQAASDRTLVISEHVKHKQLLDRQRPRTREIYQVCERDYGVVEDCPNDSRGPQGLMWGVVKARIIHVRCSYERAMPPPHIVISSYWPDSMPHKWAPDFKQWASA